MYTLELTYTITHTKPDEGAFISQYSKNSSCQRKIPEDIAGCEWLFYRTIDSMMKELTPVAKLSTEMMLEGEKNMEGEANEQAEV